MAAQDMTVVVCKRLVKMRATCRFSSSSSLGAPTRRIAPIAATRRACYATAPSQARAVVYRSVGNPGSVLKLENVPLPALGPNDVRVQMLAAPINPADLNMVSGTYGVKAELPAIGGLEGFGVVQEAGGSVSSLKRGDYVVAAKAGGYDHHFMFY